MLTYVDSFRRSDIFNEIAEHSLSMWVVKDNLSLICKPSNFVETHV